MQNTKRIKGEKVLEGLLYFYKASKEDGGSV